MPRAIHFDPDPDDNEQDRVFCGTDGEFEQRHFTPYTDQVTCKRCLKILARICEGVNRTKEVPGTPRNDSDTTL